MCGVPLQKQYGTGHGEVLSDVMLLLSGAGDGGILEADVEGSEGSEADPGRDARDGSLRV